MRIEAVHIENFRAFQDVKVYFGKYACLVGPNGAGKSTVLTALNVFFRETENLPTDLVQLVEEDFHNKDTANPIRITVTFGDLSNEAQEEFSNYFRQNQLVVSAEAAFNEETGKAQVKQYGQRLGMAAFRPFFEALEGKKKVAELKEIYSGLQTNYPNLSSAQTKDRMKEALIAFEADNPDQCELIPSEDQFYGFSKGVNRLAKHVQWVYVPAVKDATAEQVESRNSALGKLLARTVRSKTNFGDTVRDLRSQMQQQYQELLDESQNVLNEISSALQTRISEWAHPDASVRLEWKQDTDKSVRVEEPWAHILARESEFEGELARFGHGLQRSYLLALLQELADIDDANGSTLILACEEPELYQHPPQARYLASVLDKLIHGNTQVVVSTHDPRFVSGSGFEDIHMVRKDSTERRSKVSRVSFDEISQAVAEATGTQPIKPEGTLAKIHQALQPSLNEMFFARRLILVEGLEDVAYLWSYLHLLEKEDEFRRLGGHIVATNGKSQMLMPLAIARHMEIPTYIVFDADADKPDRNGSRAKHEKDNRALLALLGKEKENSFPAETYCGQGFTMWHSDIRATIKADIGAECWQAFCAKADNQYGHAGSLPKNALHIGASLAFAWEAGKRPASLETLCSIILDAGEYVPAS